MPIPAGLIPALAPAVNAGLGLLLGDYNDERQQRQQQALTDIQVNAQKELSGYNLGLQKDMWNYTNYENQIKHLQAAGLNPALLYGKGGGGGATASISPGTVSGGAAAGQAGEVQQMAAMGLQMSSQLELQRAQADALKATAEKDRAQAQKIAGVDTQQSLTTIEQLKAQTTNTNAQTALTKINTAIADIQREIATVTQTDIEKQIDLTAQKIQQEVLLLEKENIWSKETMDDRIKTVQQNLNNAVINGALQRSQIDVNNQQVQTQIKQLSINWQNMETEKREKAIHQILMLSTSGLIDKEKELATWKTINGSIGAASSAIGQFLKKGNTYNIQY